MGDFERAHHRLKSLANAVAQLLRDENGEPRHLSAPQRCDLVTLLETLGEELISHCAEEEEQLFPSVRHVFPEKTSAVDSLEAEHDNLCGAVLRLLRLARHGADWQLIELHHRFDTAFAAHGLAEDELLGALPRMSARS